MNPDNDEVEIVGEEEEEEAMDEIIE